MFKVKVPDTDAFFYDNVVDPISTYFKNVHPNYITIIGAPLSFIIYITHMFPPISFILSYSVMMLRTLCDLLDGHVARKYKKVSTLGACLDSIADTTNTANFITYAAMMIFNLTFTQCSLLFTFVMISILSVFFKSGIMFDHALIKQENSDLFGFISSICKYNLVLGITGLYVVMWFFFIYV